MRTSELHFRQLPTGREHGAYLALDLGGTNFRVILVELDNKSTSVRMKAAKHPVSEELMVGPGENLFNFMADRLRDFMLEHNLLGEEKEHHLGFTFSFPTVQHSLASADLATWTKGFVCSGVEAATITTIIILVNITTTTTTIIIRLGHVDQGLRLLRCRG